MLVLLILCSSEVLFAQSYYVDKEGILRAEKDHAEMSFFGVNYTVPFAHAYRAMDYLKVDHKTAIDKDVYHFARLGFNAYRIHVWDVEISDAKGNLLQNKHLDLLDYLIHKLKERNIRIVVTFMTNFGNGYPEKNQVTEGFSYNYGKCTIHDDPAAQAVQQHYIAGMVKHINPYTGKAYKDDPDIVGFEINNEPCHAGTPQQTKAYINGMLAALKKTGNRKPVFYNVSHNMQQIEAYYSTAIQGTTYQWYPIGLVAGQTRKGNFLPLVDDYFIPFRDVKGFDKKAMLVYEYDPADITYAYMHPAMARSFRSAGFQWITQFAYDPIDMAAYNTEYQTHYLNLAYTPQKALSMKIAAEVAYSVKRKQSFDKYPRDTVFGDFRVSYKEDLSELNSETKFFYSNHTTTQPVAPGKLVSVAGYGKSPVVDYPGTGSYFIDQLEEGVWRLEVLPDAIQVKDPFEKPSLSKEVVIINWASWPMEIRLPDLSKQFTIRVLNKQNNKTETIDNGIIPAVSPGVYLLTRKGLLPTKEWTATTHWGTIRLGEYVAPPASVKGFNLVHTPAKYTETNTSLVVNTLVVGESRPDSVVLYTDKVSFWSSTNQSFKLEPQGGYTFQVSIPKEKLHETHFRYNLIIYKNGECFTYPEGKPGNPLDWDYTGKHFYETVVIKDDSPILLVDAVRDRTSIQTYAMPDGAGISSRLTPLDPTEKQKIKFTFPSKDKQQQFYLHKYIGDDIANRIAYMRSCNSLCLSLTTDAKSLSVGFVTNMGYTYATTIDNSKGLIRIPLQALKQQNTAILPHPYPSFLKKYFEPETAIPFRTEDVEKLEIRINGEPEKTISLEIEAVWLE